MPSPPDQGGWGSASAPRPVEQILGPGALWAGPYSLLGLRPGPVTDDAVLAALDRRLEQIASHALRDTPEADETRLALHAAAAQLLDPSVRRHLEARWSGAQSPDGPEPPAPAAPAAPAPRRSAAEIALEHDAVVTLGLYGGWNQRALRRLVMLAHARGLSSQAVAMTLQRLASPRAATQLRAAGGLGAAPSKASAVRAHARTMREQLNAPDPDEVDPAARLIRRTLIIIAALAGGLVASAALITIIIALLEPGGGDATEQPPAPGEQRQLAERPESGPEPRRQPPTPAPQQSAADTPDIDTATRTLIALAGNETISAAQAMRSFDETLVTIEADWPDLTANQRIAAIDAVIEFLYSAVSTGTAADTAARIARPATALAGDGAVQPEAILPAIWSTGILNRLQRELDLPSSAQTEIRHSLADILGPRSAAAERSFDAGAAAAIGALANRLSAPDPEFWADDGPSTAAWHAWRRAVDALAAGNDTLRQRLTLAGLESILVNAPEPNENGEVFDVVRAITRSLHWRPDQLSRPTLLRWFNDRRLTSEDLHAVTSTLAQESSAEGVDVTMVVPIGASDSVRASFRARYASAWGLGSGVDRDQAVAGWRREAEAILAESTARSIRTSSPPDRLARAVRLSRLSEAASWAWRGQIEAAADRLDTLDHDLAAPSRRQSDWPQLASGYTVTRSRWAESYLAARRNIPLRSARLDELLRASGPMHIVDAELVATEALLGTPADIRRKAGEVITARANSPAITHALLEALARAPATRHTTELIQNFTGRMLPDPDTGAWRAAASRLLVERLLEQIAAEGDHGRIDRLADALAASYAARTANRPGAVPSVLAADADALAATLAARWTPSGASGAAALATTAPVLLPEIQSRTAARLNLATSTVERFCAHQASTLELMALTVTAERPAAASALTEIVGRAAEQRARATHILQQIEAVEEAMLRIWTLRLGATPGAPSAPGETSPDDPATSPEGATTGASS